MVCSHVSLENSPRPAYSSAPGPAVWSERSTLTRQIGPEFVSAKPNWLDVEAT